ncbi:MAG: phosphoribosylformylglycinamidine cyclo-ligase [Candidatus Glassbacteria bacterium RIFCSPLOWO2_12_FULL_58_11]|uniref:Phosphoribosylformylglycinamidine cyclo-ligase n=1 Tax=Candidatus Glassbacteria bacterium RIFCSPLOWO2_12_FULL_58_11 TaxID=1817867 RepID=A0A1F5YKB0_9BACT|nr:MAG: phosphoribosylformylglycinamidine cyclo-ligase [Candidatus Glassbacteria bacterium RIFCSPLOWO2_12_FULL_58_11]
MSEKRRKDAYKEAGVDIDAAGRAVGAFKDKVARTFTPGVLSQVGNFGGMYSLSGRKFKEPVLVSSTDGVGTKLLVARLARRHNTVGECLVNHCVNDIMVQGAEPLFFMDYIAVGKLVPEHIAEVMEGFIAGCLNNGIALLGGETAEMPDLYGAEDYDLAGFIVGVAERDELLTGERVKEGHLLIGLPSTGLHTNGYSLARKVIFGDKKHKVNDILPGGAKGETFGEALLAVHKSYKKPLEALFRRKLADAAAHITGGGLTDNLPRVFPDSLDAEIDRASWSVPPIFRYLVEAGELDESEACRVFNMGIGMVVIIPENKKEEALALLGSLGEGAIVIGRMVRGAGRVIYR